VNNNGAIPNPRSGRVSNAGISIKDVFNVNGGPGEVSINNYLFRIHILMFEIGMGMAPLFIIDQ